MGHWRVGPYHLAEDGTLWLGTTSVGLSPLQRRLLLAFVRQPGAVISRQRLALLGWGQEQVSDISIARTIHGLRRVLDAGPIGGRVIRTAYGQGYCFETPVERIDGHDPPQPALVSPLPFVDLEVPHQRHQVLENSIEARHRIRYGDHRQLNVAEGRLRQSLAVDPGHGPSLVLLAQVLLLQHGAGSARRSALAPDVDGLLERAGQLRPLPAGFHATWACSRSLLHWDPGAVAQRYPHGLPSPLLPQEIDLPWADHLVAVGRLEEARGLLESWLETGTALVPLRLARLRAISGDLERALRLLEVQIAREPCHRDAHAYKVLIQAHAGHPEAALATYRQGGLAEALADRPDPLLAFALARAGRGPEARALLAEARSLGQQGHPLPLASWALGALAMGESAAAGELFAQAVSERDGRAPLLAREPFLQPFADQPVVGTFLGALAAVFQPMKKPPR